MRMDDHELTQASIRFASGYMNERMKGAPHVEQNLVVNCAAHGFYMGARFAEGKRGWFGGALRRLKDMEVASHSNRAATYYISTRLQGLAKDQEALVRVALKRGFVSGVNYRAEFENRSAE